jgi:hypothetical protein
MKASLTARSFTLTEQFTLARSAGIYWEHR